MMRDPNTILGYEAKRNPMLRGMLASPDQFTEAEIAAQRFPKWIREHLINLKREQGSQTSFANSRQRILSKIQDGFTADPIGMMCQYTGETRFIMLNGGPGSLQVEDGTLVWYARSGGVWIDTIFSRIIDPKLHNLCRKVREVTKSGYQAAIRDRRNGTHQHSHVPHTVCDDGDAQGNAPLGDDRGTFRIIRF